ncbi:ribonuclease H2, subunit C [Biscogniauxia mediterranea]|nr:ribonuclease H2, subunit C [Biscogniauxia mediterranea]
MAPPVFKVASAESVDKKAQLHLLPCRIHYDGDVNPSDTFWNPSQSEDGTKTAYFRGRKLDGKTFKLPEGYYGTVAEKSDPKPEQRGGDEMTDDVEIQEDPNDQLEVGDMHGKAVFDEITIWGHETSADASEDPYIRGMEEWITFAEQIHSYPPEAESAKS